MGSHSHCTTYTVDFQSAEAEKLKEERVAAYTARKSKSELGLLWSWSIGLPIAVRAVSLCRGCCGGQVQHHPGREAVG